MGVPLFDTRSPIAPLRAELDAAIASVVDSQRFILGPEVSAFESEFAAYCGAAHAVGVANGTDALTIALRAMGVGPGDEVVVPSFTFYASPEAIPPTGATPVFCDVDPDTMCVTAETVKAALTPKYSVEEKPSALRLKGCDANRPDFHIDVVPGRFTDDKKEDVYLYRSSGDKERLKTNLQKHIDHVKDSGVQDAIRLMKLWRLRNGLSVRNFILELLTVKLLDGKSKKALTAQLEHVWTELRDNVDAISVEDPANPSGNDLSELFGGSIKDELKTVAEDTLNDIDKNGWQLIFGSVEEAKKADKRETLQRAPVIITSAPKPWAPRYTRPSRTIPPPMPVPRVSRSAWRMPRIAPCASSPHAATFASLSTMAGSPVARAMSSRRGVSTRAGTFGA